MIEHISLADIGVSTGISVYYVLIVDALTEKYIYEFAVTESDKFEIFMIVSTLLAIPTIALIQRTTTIV